MKRLIEKIVFATFIINSLLVLAIVLLPVWIIIIPDFFDKYIFILKTNPYQIYTFINLAIITHWVYCLWFLFKYDKYSKSIFPLFFFNFLYAPFYYYRVKIKKRPFRNKINRPESKYVSENAIEEKDFEKLTRDSIIEILKLWSSKSEQIDFQKAQSDINVTEELFEKWRDLFVIDSEAIKSAFSARELELLNQFDKFIQENKTQQNGEYSQLTEFIETSNWKELNLLAKKILRELNEK